MGYSMKKIKKLMRNPNLFFYDFFRKRVEGHIGKPSIVFNIASFEQFLKNIVEFEYKGKLYVKEKQRFVFLLYQVTMLNVHLRIISDYTNCYKYKTNVASYTNLLQELSKVNNVYIEIHDHKNNIIVAYDVVFVTFENNCYHSRSEIRKISCNDIKSLKKDECDYDVDIVYTYVDSKDPSWRAMYEQTFNNLDFDVKRYEAHDELKFSLRSVNQFIPWVRKIFIVSNCAKPQWLNECDRIVWVDHSELVVNTANQLPMFNSHAIESYLHRIADLSENFIYFNDDVLVNKYLEKTFFYKFKNMSINFSEQYDSVFWDHDTIGDEIGYKNASRNVQTLLYDRFKYIPRNLMQHAPHSLRKSVLYELEKMFFPQFEIVRKNKVRSRDDINILTFLYPHYGLITGRSTHVSARTAIIRESNYKKIIAENYKYQFLCLNDYNESNEQFVQIMNTFLNERFYVIPEWENTVLHRED